MKFLIFLGSVRDSTPPKPARLGLRVAQAAEEQASWFDYFARAFNQLLWWAQAAREHRAEVDPQKMIRHFKKYPSERNAP